MATKRMTDAEKWKDPFFENLPNDYKLIWLYLLDDCDNAGLWSNSIRRLNFHCNTNITEEELFTLFKDRLIPLNNDISIIPKFLIFQYGDDWVNSKSPAHISVRNKLEFRGIDPKSISSLYSNDTVSIQLGNTIDRHKDKDKVKVKDNVQDKSKDLSKEQAKDKSIVESLQAIVSDKLNFNYE